MKLTHPIAIKFVALLVAWLIRLWLGTMNIRCLADEGQADPLQNRRKCIYLFWHEMMLFPAYTHARFRIPILVSRHRDGELIAQVVRMLRGLTVRGSTTRGGLAALREMMRQGQARHLAITPDGPRGPRRVVQQGAIYLASKTGMPLVPTAYAFDDCWRAKSWDRMVLPKPFGHAGYVFGKPIHVPADLDRDGLEQVRQAVQAGMEEAEEKARRLLREA
jgi:hypothetical protein